MTFFYNHNTEEAAQIARAALPMATQHCLPANPVIYAVFYEYVAGLNPKLSRALEAAINQSSQLSNQSILDIFQLFISDDQEKAVEAMRVALGEVLETTSGSIEQMGNESKAFHQQLETTTEQLQSPELTLNSKTRSLIDNLAQESESMQLVTKSLHKQLQQARSEIIELRSEFQRVHHESLIDPLTGVKNRRAFDITIKENIELAMDENQPLCLLLLDIDHFKAINDTHGHSAGDSVLKWVARAIEQCVKGGDIVARYGGEEFTIILPNTVIEGAQSAAENIRSKMAEQKLRTSSKHIGQITCSIGVTQYQVNMSIDTFISNADAAMYQAKEAGRNRVCLFSGS